MKIFPPTTCPSCSTELTRVNAQLFCPNTKGCPAQSSKKVQDFCKKLKIKGFGEATVAKLNLSDFNDLVKLDEKYAISRGLSEHMAKKLVQVVAHRLKLGISPNDFLAACSIPLIGDGATRKLTLTKISDLTYSMCTSSGLGSKAATNLISWIELEWPMYKNTWEQYFKTEPAEDKARPTLPQVTITGKLDNFKNRTEAQKHLESLGFEVKSSVTKTVQYLICEDGSESSSFKKANQYGIPVTTIKHLEDKYVK